MPVLMCKNQFYLHRECKEELETNRGRAPGIRSSHSGMEGQKHATTKHTGRHMVPGMPWHVPAKPTLKVSVAPRFGYTTKDISLRSTAGRTQQERGVSGELNGESNRKVFAICPAGSLQLPT